MAAAPTSASSPPGPSGALRGARPPGVGADRLFRALAFAGGAVVLVVLALIAYYTTKQAWPAFRHEGASFLFSSDWDPAKDKFGALGFVFGTVVISVIGVLLAVPVSIGIALFVTEVAPRPLRRPIVYFVDLLAAIPSVVYGLWAILVFAPAVQGLYENVSDASSGVPVLGSLLSGAPVTGRSVMTAGIVLAIMITPIVTSITREVFATTPRIQKEAALALGATRWEMIRAAVFPSARSGMVSAVLIGLGRAMGETIAVALVIGNSTKLSSRLFGPGSSLASGIVLEFFEATGTHRAALIGLGVVLFALTIVIGVVARAVVARADRRFSGVTL